MRELYERGKDKNNMQMSSDFFAMKEEEKLLEQEQEEDEEAEYKYQTCQPT